MIIKKITIDSPVTVIRGSLNTSHQINSPYTPKTRYFKANLMHALLRHSSAAIKKSTLTSNVRSFILHSMKTPHYETILSFYGEHRRMPSYAEIARITGLRSKSSAFHVANRLVKEGWLLRDDGGKLVPGPRTRGIRILGSIAAGFPSPA